MKKTIYLIIFFIFLNVFMFGQKIQAEPDRQVFKCTPQMRALATGAILAERNNHRHDILAGCERNEANIRSWKKSLKDWWGVNSRLDLLKTLIWLQEEGHRKEFNKMANYVSSKPEEQLKKILNSILYSAQQKHRLKVVRENYEKLGDKSILGWDMIRYVALCRWGYLIGYLSEDEAWAKIMSAAQLLQNVFDSWQDLGENYLIGRRFWSMSQTEKTGELFKRAYDKLLDDPASPWNTCPWDTDLSSN